MCRARRPCSICAPASRPRRAGARGRGGHAGGPARGRLRARAGAAAAGNGGPQHPPMDVRYRVEPGPRVAIGAIEVEGLEHLSDAFVRRRLGLEPGRCLQPEPLGAGPADLAASGAIASARLIPAAAVDADGRLPLRVTVVEASAAPSASPPPLPATTAPACCSAGPTATCSGAPSGCRCAASSAPSTAAPGRSGLCIRGIAAAAGPLAARPRPGVRPGRRQRIPEGVRPRRHHAGRRAGAAPVVAAFSLSLGAAFERSRIAGRTRGGRFDLLSLPMTPPGTARTTRRRPRKGCASARAWSRALGAGRCEPFARVSADGCRLSRSRAPRSRARRSPMPQATLPPATRCWRGRIALGRILGADASAVPPDWRLYAGGAGSVRGYPYQSIGPRTARNQPAGGDASLEASVELRRRLGGPWGIVAFSDVGSVTANGLTGSRRAQGGYRSRGALPHRHRTAAGGSRGAAGALSRRRARYSCISASARTSDASPQAKRAHRRPSAQPRPDPPGPAAMDQRFCFC
jgi:translocation and assembly module TamA